MAVVVVILEWTSLKFSLKIRIYIRYERPDQLLGSDVRSYVRLNICISPHKTYISFRQNILCKMLQFLRCVLIIQQIIAQYPMISGVLSRCKVQVIVSLNCLQSGNFADFAKDTIRQTKFQSSLPFLTGAGSGFHLTLLKNPGVPFILERILRYKRPRYTI